MAFTTAERERIRYHLGYGSVQPAASLNYGVPQPVQTLFLVESAMNNILPEAEDRCRRIIGVMDGVENQLVDAQLRLAAEKLDELTIRKDETDALEREYVRWGMRLADQLMVPLYAYSTRYRMAGGLAGSIPVRNN